MLVDAIGRNPEDAPSCAPFATEGPNIFASALFFPDQPSLAIDCEGLKTLLKHQRTERSPDRDPGLTQYG
jgi:hypothetical protein